MGRLGFNLVRQKEAAKAANVEAGLPDQQQNASNEHVEIGELILAVEERNRKIKNLQLLSSLLTVVIIMLCGYILLGQSRLFTADQADSVEPENMMLAYENTVEALKETCDERIQQQLEELRKNFSDLQAHKAQVQADLTASLSKTFADELEKSKDSLWQACQTAQHDLKVELRRLGDERAELERKLAEANRRIELQASSLVRQPKSSPTPPPSTTTTTTAKTTTAAPRSTGVFDRDLFQGRINDLLKDIENGAAMNKPTEFWKKFGETFS